ncbi:MAG: tripartite tricarboxylate transporter substrate binding protein [Rubrivivax sp.]
MPFPSRWRRRLAACALLALAAGAQAQKPYPERALRLIVPYAAGSAADTLSRLVAGRLAEQLGQAIVIDNKAGAGGTIGTVEIARAAPDGYTLGIAAQGTLVNNMVLYEKPGYDPLKDFAFIGRFADVQNLLVVSATSRYQNVGELLADIRARPPETFRYSSSGAGTSHHVAGVMLAQHLKTPLLHVPYTGAPQGLTAILSGDVDLGLYNLPVALGLATSGKLRPLAVTGPARSALLPQVPTLEEAGLKGYSVTLWWGLVGPAGLPPALVERLHAELNRVMSRPDVRSRLTEQGFTLPPVPLAPPADFQRLVQADLETWVPLLRKLDGAGK